MNLRFFLPILLLAGAPAWGQVEVWKPKRPGSDKDLRLQDFCIFRHAGYMYAAPMMKDHCNEGIFVGRSRNLKRWEVLGTAVSRRTAEDKSMVWAPHVVRDGGTFYMFYTGVTTPKKGRWCQVVCLATTRKPGDVADWQRDLKARFLVDGKEENYFRPSHEGSVWTDKDWADCRDPMVLKEGDTWYMFYTGSSTRGGIMGVAAAPHPRGPWTDRGAAMVVTPGIPESCFVLKAPDGSWVVVFNHAGNFEGRGSKTARGKSLLPVDGEPSFTDIRPLGETSGKPLQGWAHEFIPADEGKFTAAYLTGYFLNFEEVVFHKEEFGWTVNAAGN